MATVFVANPTRFAEHINRVVTLGPVFAGAIIEHFANKNNSPTIPWEFCLDLIAKIVHEQPRGNPPDELAETTWTTVRLSIVRLLQRGIYKATLFPMELFNRAEALLIKLLNDADPEPNDDNPLPGYVGHDDPLTQSLNHVRPIALATLIQLQREQVKHATGEVNQSHSTGRELDPVICVALSQRLNPIIEPSPSVRAVFGCYLLLLYWLDKRWTESNLDLIFPIDENPKSVQFFLAAFNTFLVSYHYCNYVELRKLLYCKYVVAIQRLDTKLERRYPDPVQGLAKHAIADYLFGDYALTDSISRDNLLEIFFTFADKDALYQAAWAAWHFCTEQPGRFWQKVKLLWTRRLDTVNGVGSLVDYHSEFCWYVQLLPVISHLESFADLWDMIIATLPYIFSSYETRNAWNKLEEYLEQQVQTEPLRAIELYRIMRSYTNDPYKFEPNDTRRKILETAAANEQSRSAALTLIDSIGRLGVHGYWDIYERYR